MVLSVRLGVLPSSSVVGLPRPLTRFVWEMFCQFLFEDYKAGWPVDTGRSKRGLSYRVQGAQGFYTMVVSNRWDYALWVMRVHYPFRRNRNIGLAVRRTRRRLLILAAAAAAAAAAMSADGDG